MLWACCCLLAMPASVYYEAPQLKWILPAVGLIAIFRGCTSTSVYTAKRNLSLGRLTSLEFSAEVVALCITVAWAVINPSIWALVVGAVMTAVVLCTGQPHAVAGDTRTVLLEQGGISGAVSVWQVDFPEQRRSLPCAAGRPPGSGEAAALGFLGGVFHRCGVGRCDGDRRIQAVRPCVVPGSGGCGAPGSLGVEPGILPGASMAGRPADRRWSGDHGGAGDYYGAVSGEVCGGRMGVAAAGDQGMHVLYQHAGRELPGGARVSGVWAMAANWA